MGSNQTSSSLLLSFPTSFSKPPSLRYSTPTKNGAEIVPFALRWPRTRFRPRPLPNRWLNTVFPVGTLSGGLTTMAPIPARPNRWLAFIFRPRTIPNRWLTTMHGFQTLNRWPPTNLRFHTRQNRWLDTRCRVGTRKRWLATISPFGTVPNR